MAADNSIGSQVLDLAAACIDATTLRGLENMRLSPRYAARVQKFARKANEGTLQPDERAEYEDYVKTRGFFAILQAKARLQLRQQSKHNK